MNLSRASLIFVLGAASGAAAFHYGAEWLRDREVRALETEVQALAAGPFDAERFVAAGRRMHAIGHDGGAARLGAVHEALLDFAALELQASLDPKAPRWGSERSDAIHASLELAFTGEHKAGATLMWSEFMRERDRRILEACDRMIKDGTAAKKDADALACMGRLR